MYSGASSYGNSYSYKNNRQSASGVSGLGPNSTSNAQYGQYGSSSQSNGQSKFPRTGGSSINSIGASTNTGGVGSYQRTSGGYNEPHSRGKNLYGNSSSSIQGGYATKQGSSSGGYTPTSLGMQNRSNTNYSGYNYSNSTMANSMKAPKGSNPNNQPASSFSGFGLTKSQKTQGNERNVSNLQNSRQYEESKQISSLKPTQQHTAQIRTNKNSHKSMLMGDFYGHGCRESEDQDRKTSMRGSMDQYSNNAKIEEEKYVTKTMANLKEKSFSHINPSGGQLSKVGAGYGYSQIGLRNIGNTCFMNSILQCIFATAPLTKYFLADFPNEKKLRSQNLAKSFHDLIKTARANKGGAIAPSELKNKVSVVARQFSGYGQQDSHEFLTFLLDGMHNELNRVEKKPKYQEIDCDAKPVDEQSEIWKQYNRARDNSIITDLFEGQLCSVIECTKCGFKSYSFDNYLDLSVSIPRSAIRYTGKVKVQDCIDNYIAPETMEKCGYKCSKCKAVDNMQKQLTLFRFPKILVIHLKRFYNSTMRREKLGTQVSIPQTLDMSPYAKYSNHPSVQQSKNYKLYGISHHSGTMNGGHYIGEVQNLDNGMWFDCNDSHCSKISGPEQSSSTAYVLFYIQQD